MIIVIPVHGRLAIAYRVVAYYKRMGHKVLTAGGVREDVGADYHVVASNKPLGAKFNSGVGMAHFLYPEESVMIVGSDSYIHADYFAAYEAQATKYPYTNTNGLYLWFPDEGDLFFNQRFRCGTGVVFSPSLLARCDGQPYGPLGDRGLDANPRKFAGCGGVHEFVGPYVLEERSPDAMWSRAWHLEQPGVERVEDVDGVLSRFGLR